MTIVKEQILIVDDESSVREMISILLQQTGYSTVDVPNGNAALNLFKQGNRFDLVITDLTMDDGDGMMVLNEVKLRQPDCPVIMITAFGTADTAVEAMKSGAHDYISKPFNIEEFKIVVKQALQHSNLIRENIALKARVSGKKQISDLIGSSEAIKNIAATCQKLADSKVSVLLSGESGTGKEVVARAIHFSGIFKEKPFIAVNCGALPEQLMESELFGHVKGAFTGASTDKKGLIAAAEDGTLFLDEIGELPLSLQVKLLRVLQEKRVRPVGGEQEIKINIRVISATNANLDELIANNLFRTDLYYRLNVMQIKLPPLRDRSEDIPALINAILPVIAADNGIKTPLIEPKALKALLNYSYPGNVRELKNILERTIALSANSLIEFSDLPDNIISSNSTDHIDHGQIIPSTGLDLDKKLSEIEKEYIWAALKLTGGVQSSAAKLLGITLRSLRYRLNREDNDEPIT
ncbi:MAG: sigma-54-dependent Fis family transcriptional regulator [Deltaproteobacteria bacterium]|nr:sigma-54-dependent Fis family transcriptional regulator [Deltaproteobacteria bacterium]